MRKTVSSRSISSVMAWFSASRKEITAMIASLLGDEWGHRDVFIQHARGRRLALLGEGYALLDCLLDTLVHAFDRLVVDPAALFQDVLINEDRVVADRGFHLLLEAVLARVADRVAFVAIRPGLDEGGPLAGSCP